MKLYPIAILSLVLLASGASASDSSVISSIDLSQPFGTRSGWRFIATQGADIPDPLGGAEDKAPGPIHLCISADGGRSCRPDLEHVLTPPKGPDPFSQAHSLTDARIVRSRANEPLLLVQVASLHAFNSDRRVATMVLAYDRARDAFTPVYEKRTGQNNNQEIRYIDDGSLKGAIISAEPTLDAPFAFWITVSKRQPAKRYEQVLRYRSATIYGDGNPLAVIDSEMPNIQQRLGLWRSGLPLPLPKRGCTRPRLIHMALWC